MTDMTLEDATRMAQEFEAARNAELHPDLAGYVFDGPFGKCLKHPLVFEVPLIFPGHANRAYEQKRKALAAAEAAKDWSACVFLHERAHRTDALVEYVIGSDDFGSLTYNLEELDQEGRDIALSVWTDSENIGQNLEVWNQLFDVPDECGLLAGDQEAYNALPDEITVYRGDCPDGGWSWSTKRDVAVFFARRWNDNWPLLTGVVQKKYVFAYLTNRSEDEIMVRADRVTVTTTEAVGV